MLSIRDLDKITEINTRYTERSDKFFRMFANVSTNLLLFESGIIFIEFINGKKKLPTCYSEALKHALYWKYSNPELNDAIGFVVVCKNTQRSQGTVLDLKKLKEADYLRNIVNAIKAPVESNIDKIYTGIFSDKMMQGPTIDGIDQGNAYKFRNSNRLPVSSFFVVIKTAVIEERYPYGITGFTDTFEYDGCNKHIITLTYMLAGSVRELVREVLNRLGLVRFEDYIVGKLPNHYGPGTIIDNETTIVNIPETDWLICYQNPEGTFVEYTGKTDELSG
jgi:hypothetical protein